MGSVIVGGIGNNTTGGTWDIATCTFTVAPTPCNAGQYSFIGGGFQNRASGCISSLVGGIRNTASGYLSTISGGYTNVASGISSSILGGSNNDVSGLASSISGGVSNRSQGIFGFIGGGVCNNLCHNTSGCLALGAVVVGGVGNNTTGGTWDLATCSFTVAPTICNAGRYSFIGAGLQNRATAESSSVINGLCNYSCGNYSTISNGVCNSITNQYSFVGSGTCHVLSNTFSAIISGANNTISTYNSGIVSGRLGTISGNYSFIGSGSCNVVSGLLSAIGTGEKNLVQASFSFIGSGFCNNICNSVGAVCALGSVVVGGVGNNTTGGTFVPATCTWSVNPTICNAGQYSTIVGGLQNIASANFSGILGGKSNNTSTFCDSFIIGSCLTSLQACTTFVNCLSAANLTPGCSVIVGTNNVLVNGPTASGTNIYNSDGTLTGNRVLTTGGFSLTFDGVASNPSFYLNANTSVARTFGFRAGNANRWTFDSFGTETGSNVGSDFYLRSWNDAGTSCFTPFYVERRTGETSFTSCDTLTNNTENITGIYNVSTGTFAAGLSTITGNPQGAIHNRFFSQNCGNLTIGQDNVFGAGQNFMRARPLAAGTVTFTQGTGGEIRVGSAQANQLQYDTSLASVTYSHLASLQALGVYRISASNQLCVTNAYQLLLNDLNESAYASSSLCMVNRWGIYQAGALDHNYIAGNFLLGTTSNTNGTKALVVNTGTAPSTNVTDSFTMYSADVVAGNAAAHFRTENGSVVKVYQETTAVGSATIVSPGGGGSIHTNDTFDGYTIGQVVKALRNQGLLA